jgi:hypothetical protein
MLAAICPPKNVVEILKRQALYWNARHPFSQAHPVGVIEQVFKAGARWITFSYEEIATVRSDLQRADDAPEDR